MSIIVNCDYCHRNVPVAPGCFTVSVPHVAVSAVVELAPPPGKADVLGVYTQVTAVPCLGNAKRKWREALDHPAVALGRQHATLDDDSMWDL